MGIDWIIDGHDGVQGAAFQCFPPLKGERWNAAPCIEGYDQLCIVMAIWMYVFSS